MKLRKLLAMLLALAMIVSLSTVALADDPPAGMGDMPPDGMGGGGGGSFTLAEGQLSVWIKDGVVVAPGTEGATEYKVDRIVTSNEDNISSFAGGGSDATTVKGDDYAFTTALYVKDGAVVADLSVTEAILEGEYDDVSAKGLVIKSDYEGFNPIIVVDSKYTITGANIIINSEGDGTKTCDFSGLGAAIAAYGDETVLVIEDSDISVSGVANLTLFADDGSDVIIENTKLHSDGGTLYESYLNGPDQSTMVAPPWILGIMGTSRTTNLEGNNTSTTVIDSDVSAAQWAVLSTDAGQNMKLNVVNTTMSLTGADYPLQEGGLFTTAYGVNGEDANPYTDRSGYGTYTIGSADEWFYGVTMNVGTYANIFTGGYGTYTSMKAGEEITLFDANGEVLTTYTPTEDKVTTINSDTFGFMAHQNTNELTVEKGTVVNSGYTSFLYKTGCSIDAEFTSGSVLNPGNGILIQALDNDDSTTGMDVATFSFYTTHEENAGWPEESMKLGNNAGNFTFTDVVLVGDIFNGSGWKLNANNSGMGGDLESVAVNVVLDGSTTLEGQISSTATIHVSKAGADAIKAAPAGAKASEDWLQYQLTSFPIGEYWNIGQVANMVKSSGQNPVNVTIEDQAVWTVTADGIVNNVTAASTAIVADKAVTLTVEGTLTIDGEVVTADTTIGNVTFDVAEEEVEPETPAAPVAPAGTYVVKAGDNLWNIAVATYGNGRKWEAIYQANATAIKDPNVIFVGQVLQLPQ